MHVQMIQFYVAVFAWFLCSFGPLSRALVAYHLGRVGMPLHYVVGVKCENGAALRMFYKCVCVI